MFKVFTVKGSPGNSYDPRQSIRQSWANVRSCLELRSFSPIGLRQEHNETACAIEGAARKARNASTGQFADLKTTDLRQPGGQNIALEFDPA